MTRTDSQSQSTDKMSPPPEWLAPIETTNLVTPEAAPSAPGRCLLSLMVMSLTSCMCVVVIGLSIVAGVRDEVDAVQTDEAREVATELAFQYDRGVQDEAQGRLELACDRLEWVATQDPSFRDVVARQQSVCMRLSVTPTLSSTSTPTPTLTPTASPSPAMTATPTAPPVAEYFAEAEKYLDFGYYEDAIEWLDVVIATDSDYRQTEVQQMLFTALVEQANRYFSGVNPVSEESSMGLPGNQLARGIQLTDRALELQAANPTVGNYSQIPHYTRNFVARFLQAQSFLDNGEFQRALVILDALCEENCAWEYRGVSVQSLRQRALNGS